MRSRRPSTSSCGSRLPACATRTCRPCSGECIGSLLHCGRGAQVRPACRQHRALAAPGGLQALLQPCRAVSEHPQQDPVAPPRCRDELPQDANENPDAAAIQAILDETSPEEAAEGFKVRGPVQRCHKGVLLQVANACNACALPPPRCSSPRRTCCCLRRRLHFLLHTTHTTPPTPLPAALRPAEPGKQRAEDGAAGQEEVLPAAGH